MKIGDLGECDNCDRHSDSGCLREAIRESRRPWQTVRMFDFSSLARAR